MALLGIDGFDTYSDPSQITTRAGFIQWTRALFPQIIQGRFSGATNQAVRFTAQGSASNQTSLFGSFAENMSTIYLGYATKIESVYDQTHMLALMETNTQTEQVRITFHGQDGSIETPYGRTTNNQFATDTWIFVEVGLVCSKTAGRLTIRVNGVSVVDIQNVNTSPSVNTWINGVRYILDWPNPMNIDDVYVCDNTTGPGAFACNTFLGDRRVLTLRLTGPGDLTQWSPNGASTNWQAASVADGDGSYNATTVAGAEDLFTVNPLPSTVTSILAVQVTGAYKKDEAASHTLTQHVKSGGVDVAGTGFLAPYALGSTYTVYSDLFPLDPSTNAAWTPAAVNAMQIGYKLET